MEIRCPICRQLSESPFEIEEGRSVCCPYCNTTFQYTHKGGVVFEMERPRNRRENKCISASNKGYKTISKKPTLSFLSKNSVVAIVAVASLLTMLAVVVVVLKNTTSRNGALLVGEEQEIETNKHFKSEAQEEFDAIMDDLTEKVIAKVGKKKFDSEVAKLKKESKKLAQQLHKYVSDDEIECRLDGAINEMGAFGLKWWSKPLNSSYKIPCEVEYEVDGYFQKVTLSYDDRGLCFVSFHSEIPDQTPSIPQEIPRQVRQQMLDAISSAPVAQFNAIVELAEQVTGEDIMCARMGDKLLGISSERAKCVVGIRVDLPPTKKPRLVYFAAPKGK